jgi:hypothetical protein
MDPSDDRPLACPICRHDHSTGDRAAVLSWLAEGPPPAPPRPTRGELRADAREVWYEYLRAKNKRLRRHPIVRAIAVVCHDGDCYRQWKERRGDLVIYDRPLGLCTGERRYHRFTEVGLVANVISLIGEYHWTQRARQRLAAIVAVLAELSPLVAR